jgi:hypothetical protein
MENPKDIIGMGKLPLHLWPASATCYGCLGMLEGALKYGRNNFRVAGIRVSIYIDACKRHLDAYFEGEDYDPDSGLHHLSHALATIAIIIECIEAGNLIDDRNCYTEKYRDLIDRITPNVNKLKEKYNHVDPIHYTYNAKKEIVNE